MIQHSCLDVSLNRQDSAGREGEITRGSFMLSRCLGYFNCTIVS